MVLVTGSAGLVGTELTRQLLSHGIKVKALYNKNAPQLEHPLLAKVQCSILDVVGLDEVFNDVDEVYHCAGLVSFTGNNSQDLYKINTEGTANIVNAALDHGVRKLIHVSSVAAFGKSKNHELVNEEMQWTESEKSSQYGVSKYLGEMEVWRGISEGLNAVIINPSIILGAGNWNDGSSALFKSAYNSFPWYTEGEKGFVDVRDVAAIMIMLMQSNVSGERFIVSAVNMKFKEIFSMMATCFNTKPPARKASPMMGSLVWRLEALKQLVTGKPALITRETAKTAFSSERYDNNKLLKRFPQFSYLPVDQSIRDTCNSLQQKVNNR